MQAYIPSNESIDLRASAKKRGLEYMSPQYVGANAMDSGGVSKLAANPQGTTTLNYESQNEGQNLQTNIPGKTVEAANNAKLAITESSGAEEQAQLYNRVYKGALIQAAPNLESSATEELGRKLNSPEEQQQHLGNIAISRAQNRMLG